MQGTETLVALAGAVALLLWATRLVRTGIERAFGARLTSILSRALRHRLASAGFGAGLAFALQSSTAVILLTSGFVASGHMAALPAIAAAAGADLGSALLATVLRLDLSMLSPLLLIAGVASFRSSPRPGWRQAGRIAIGLGLLLLALRLIGEAAAPLRDATGLPILARLIAGDPVMVLLLAAALTWLLHSSLAAVILAATLVDQAVLPAAMVVPVVLGINLGGAVMALTLCRSLEPAGRTVPLANLALRGGVAALGVAAVLIRPDLLAVPWTGGAAVLWWHVGFNALVLLAGLILAGPLAVLGARIVARSAEMAPGRVTALVAVDLAQPVQALRNAGREAMALAAEIEAMIRCLPDLLREGRDDDFARVAGIDAIIDRQFAAIRDYLARIDPGASAALAAEQARLLKVIVRLEQVGDVAAQRVAVRARKRRDRAAMFSPDGWAELSAMLAEIAVTARLASNLVAAPDMGLARRLVEQKASVRAIERRSLSRHLERLRAGNLDTSATSTLHIDTLVDLKDINSLLVEIAYPLLESTGQLRSDRLVAERSDREELAGAE